MRTPPTSVLCTMEGETILSTTRSPGRAVNSSSEGQPPRGSSTVRGGVSAQAQASGVYTSYSKRKLRPFVCAAWNRSAIPAKSMVLPMMHVLYSNDGGYLRICQTGNAASRGKRVWRGTPYIPDDKTEWTRYNYEKKDIYCRCVRCLDDACYGSGIYYSRFSLLRRTGYERKYPVATMH